jgi:hypothetical protein
MMKQTKKEVTERSLADRAKENLAPSLQYSCSGLSLVPICVNWSAIPLVKGKICGLVLQRTGW